MGGWGLGGLIVNSATPQKPVAKLPPQNLNAPFGKSIRMKKENATKKRKRAEMAKARTVKIPSRRYRK